MFNKLGSILKGKFSRKDDFSKQVEIAQVLDLARAEIKKLLPRAEDIEVVSLKNKTLLIQIPNSVLASELRLREYEMIKKINKQLGKEALEKVIYRF